MIDVMQFRGLFLASLLAVLVLSHVASSQSFELDEDVVSEVEARPCQDTGGIMGVIAQPYLSSGTDEALVHAYTSCALDFLQNRDYQRAIAHLNLAIDLHPAMPSAQALSLRAEAWRSVGEYSAAIQDFRLAQQISFGAMDRRDRNTVMGPDYIDVYVAEIFIEAGDYAQAVESIDGYFDRNVRNSRRSEVNYLRGLANYLQRSLESSLEDYSRALELPFPGEYEARVLAFRALVYAELGDFNAAFGDLDHAQDVEPSIHEIYTHRAYLQCLLCEMEQAVSSLVTSYDLLDELGRALVGQLFAEQGLHLEDQGGSAAADVEDAYRTILVRGCDNVGYR